MTEKGREGLRSSQGGRADSGFQNLSWAVIE